MTRGYLRAFLSLHALRSPSRVRRRTRMLSVSVSVASVLIAAACQSGTATVPKATSPSPGSASPDGPSATPSSSQGAASRSTTRWPIKHVVFLIKENRSFDNLFGTFPGANGASFGMDHGTRRPLTRGTDGAIPADIPHCYTCSRQAWDHGKMDGFNQGAIADQWAYTQLRRPQLPNYWEWASSYVLSDRFFSSAQGPSFPNHLFSIAAQSGGSHDDPRRTPGLPSSNTFGCDAPAGQTVQIVDSEGNVKQVPPCFNFLTEGDLLSRAGIPWGYYAANPTELGYIWSSYSAIRHIRETGQWHRHVFPVDRLVNDIGADRLPPVTWISPRFEVSDHPDVNFCRSENWSTKVIDAIMKSPIWKSTAIFLTWDDYGGWYDHLPPPQVDHFGFGIRVPMLTISPYAKQGVVDHHLGEFSSVLRFIEDNWGLSQLTNRDRSATDLSYNFDFSQHPRPPDPLPPRKNC